jgi:RNA polymerase sigma-70 factor (ECF subfamily)
LFDVGLRNAKPKLELLRNDAQRSERIESRRAGHERAEALDDAELLASVRAGDEDAADALYERLRPRVESTARRLLGARDPELEDCVQNAFVEIVRSIEKYRGECSLEHWAAQICAHVVYNQIRKRRAHRRVFESPAEPPEEKREPVQSARRLLARDLVARVREKLSSMETDKTYAFLLHDVLGFDLKEIAQITGVSVAAAQQRLVRGRRAVHAELANDAELAAVARELGEEP